MKFWVDGMSQWEKTPNSLNLILEVTWLSEGTLSSCSLTPTQIPCATPLPRHSDYVCVNHVNQEKAGSWVNWLILTWVKHYVTAVGSSTRRMSRKVTWSHHRDECVGLTVTRHSIFLRLESKMCASWSWPVFTFLASIKDLVVSSTNAEQIPVCLSSKL